jgi:histidinol-phosphate/aromatic aminotransferase/cobyric acid decarboxylase-like protein
VDQASLNSGHGGDLHKLSQQSGKAPDELLDFSANLNPLGPPRWLNDVYVSSWQQIPHYPEPKGASLIAVIAKCYGIPEDTIVLGHGSSQLIHHLPRVTKAQRVILLDPCYMGYERAARSNDTIIVRATTNAAVPSLADLPSLREGDLVFLGYPINPTGQFLESSQVMSLAQNHPGVHFAIDEAFMDFAPKQKSFIEMQRPSNITVLRSMTKFYAMGSIRLGFAVTSPVMAKRFEAQLPEWNLGTCEQNIARACLQDDHYRTRSLKMVEEWRKTLMEGLNELGQLKILPSGLNYLYIELTHERQPDKMDGKRGIASPPMKVDELQRKLLNDHGMAIRNLGQIRGCSDRVFRIAVRTPRENKALLRALRNILNADSHMDPAPISHHLVLMDLVNHANVMELWEEHQNAIGLALGMNSSITAHLSTSSSKLKAKDLWSSSDILEDECFKWDHHGFGQWLLFVPLEMPMVMETSVGLFLNLSHVLKSKLAAMVFYGDSQNMLAFSQDQKKHLEKLTHVRQIYLKT